MIKAYLILAHNKPEQLLKLIDAINDGLSDFFIHIDKRADITGFDFLTSDTRKVIFVKRASAKWGSFGLVEATLNGLPAIKANNKNYEAIILLSGHDYPIKSNSFINEFLQ